MKKRNGFISNSSSTSFIIQSKYHTLKDIIEMQVVLLDTYNKLNETNLQFEDVYEGEAYIGEEDDIVLEGWDHMYPTKGNIILHSTSDNTIPWEIQQWFETIGERIHRG